ncbi:MAG: LacI family DNA-binding transcriptional regulator [Victivallaceae bacterium]|nr:LacI family DNA-binding transcriptional regulator [Victivallaceae bacterium]
MTVTIHDLARLANCNASTVSRALHGDQRVAAKTREKIVDLAHTHHYVPNQNARNLVTGHTGAVAMVVSTLESVLERTCARELTRRFNDAGFELLLLVSDNSWERMKRFIAFLRRRPVDGVLIIPPTEDADSCTISEFASLPVPQIWIDRYSGSRFPVVTSDNHIAIGDLFAAGVKAGADTFLLPSKSECKNAVSRDRFDYLVQLINAQNMPIFFEYSDFAAYIKTHKESRPCLFTIGGYFPFEQIHSLGQPDDLIGCFFDFVPDSLRDRIKHCFVCQQDFSAISEAASRIMLSRLTGKTEPKTPEFLRIPPFAVESVASF